jgi:protoheme IX farnesyltransferase
MADGDIVLERPPARPLPLEAGVGDFLALLKPRVMSLVVFTGFAGLVAAPGSLHPLLAAIAVLCIAVGAGAAGAINMWYDRDIDALMTRTAQRPIPAGRMDPSEALAFGVVLSIASVVTMALAVNLVAAALLALSIAFYVFVYTMWLKRSTPHNIVIGGAAGAFPPMIGWSAVTGDVGLGSIALFLIVFMWTPPHSWALALFRAGEYAKAGVPMLPVVAGIQATKRHILAYSATLLPLGVLPTVLGVTGITYAIVSLVLGAVFMAGAVAVWRDAGDTNDKPAKLLFGYSIVYLFLLFILLMIDRVTAVIP